MRRKMLFLTILCLVPSLAMVFPVGCDHNFSAPAELENLSLDAATAALLVSLDHWKNGDTSAASLIKGVPSVGVTDSLRSGRRLIGYRMSGSLGEQDKARAFLVTLELDAPVQIVSSRYIVFGQDPIWVFRQEDYERVLHWEHNDDSGPHPATSPVKPGEPKP